MINAEKIKEIFKSGKTAVLNKATLGVAALGLTSMLLTGCSENKSGNAVNLDYDKQTTSTPTPTVKPTNAPANNQTSNTNSNVTATPTPTNTPIDNQNSNNVDDKFDNSNTPTPTQIEVIDEVINNSYKELKEQGFTQDEIRAMYIGMNIDLPVLRDDDDKKIGKKTVKSIKRNLMQFANKVANYETVSPYDIEISKEGQGINMDYSKFIINDGSEEKDAQIRMLNAIDEEIKAFQENPTRESFAKVINILISTNQGGVKYTDANGVEKEGTLPTTMAQIVTYGKARAMLFYTYNSTNLNDTCNDLINTLKAKFVDNCDFTFAQKDMLVTIDEEAYQLIKVSTK